MSGDPVWPERVDFGQLNRAAAQEMERRQARAYGAALERAQPLTAQDFADVVEEHLRDESGQWVEYGTARYPSERWERIPVDQVRYPGLTRRIARRMSGRAPMWFAIACGVVCAALSTASVPMLPVAAPMFGVAVAVVALAGYVRRRHTA